MVSSGNIIHLDNQKRFLSYASADCFVYRIISRLPIADLTPEGPAKTKKADEAKDHDEDDEEDEDEDDED